MRAFTRSLGLVTRVLAASFLGKGSSCNAGDQAGWVNCRFAAREGGKKERRKEGRKEGRKRGSKIIVFP